MNEKKGFDQRRPKVATYPIDIDKFLELFNQEVAEMGEYKPYLAYVRTEYKVWATFGRRKFKSYEVFKVARSRRLKILRERR